MEENYKRILASEWKEFTVIGNQVKSTPVWNAETIANQQIMNEHLANFKRECKVKQFKSEIEAKKTKLG
jgi:hypothetical protein